jgi:outer membrane immunogenic protein
MIYRSLIAFLAVAGTATSASAAPFDWSGFYAGFNLGVDVGSSSFTDQPAGNGLPWLITGDQFTAYRIGPTLSVEAGYNLQISNFVVGIEGEVGYLGGSGRGESQSVLPPGNGIYGYILPGPFASVRLRAGVAADGLLVFATAGGIIADHRAYMQDAAFGGLTSETGLVGGVIAGGGVEYALAADWTVKVEGLYYQLADKVVTGSDPFAGPAYNVASKGGLVRIGFNRKF